MSAVAKEVWRKVTNHTHSEVRIDADAGEFPNLTKKKR